MFDAIGHSVVKLKRVAIGPIADRSLAVGANRSLTRDEIDLFRSPLQKPARK